MPNVASSTRNWCVAATSGVTLGIALLAMACAPAAPARGGASLVSSAGAALASAAAPVAYVESPTFSLALDRIDQRRLPLDSTYRHYGSGAGVTVYVFDGDGKLKARQVAPARRELAVGETKFSAMVLDVGKIEPTDSLMAGVDQAQHVGSDDWWRVDLRTIAEKVAAAKAPPAKK